MRPERRFKGRNGKGGFHADCPAAMLLRTRFQSIADSAGSVPFVISRNLVVAHQKPDNDQDARNAETPRDQIFHVCVLLHGM
jgi:hypothetical protein